MPAFFCSGGRRPTIAANSKKYTVFRDREYYRFHELNRTEVILGHFDEAFAPSADLATCLLALISLAEQDFEHGTAKFSQPRRGRNGNRFDQAEVCHGCRQNHDARERQAERL